MYSNFDTKAEIFNSSSTLNYLDKMGDYSYYSTDTNQENEAMQSSSGAQNQAQPQQDEN
jgi:hypothetical protein